MRSFGLADTNPCFVVCPLNGLQKLNVSMPPYWSTTVPIPPRTSAFSQIIIFSPNRLEFSINNLNMLHVIVYTIYFVCVSVQPMPKWLPRGPSFWKRFSFLRWSTNADQRTLIDKRWSINADQRTLINESWPR